jgi:hypothetical protein
VVVSGQINTPREAENLNNQGGHSPDLLADQSLDDLEVPPELPSQWAPVLGAPETPLRGLAIGELRSPSPVKLPRCKTGLYLLLPFLQ